MPLLNYTYNMTKLANADTVFAIVQFADDATGNVMIPLLVFAIVLIFMIVTTRRNEPEEAILYSFFVGFILSGILWYGHLLNWMYLLGFFIGFCLVGLYKWIKG